MLQNIKRGATSQLCFLLYIIVWDLPKRRTVDLGALGEGWVGSNMFLLSRTRNTTENTLNRSKVFFFLKFEALKNPIWGELGNVI